MQLTTIQKQVLADIAANKPVGFEQARSAALSSLKKKGLVALGSDGKHKVTPSGSEKLQERAL